MINGGSYYWEGPSYNIDKIKAIREIGDDNEPSANYKCPFCGGHTFIDDYQKRTPSWCDNCGEVKTFVKLKWVDD